MNFSRTFVVLLIAAVFLSTGCGKKKEAATGLDIEVKQVEPIRFCYIDNVGPYDQIGDKFAQIGAMMAQHQVSGHVIGLFFDDPARVAPEECRSQLGIQVPEEFAAPEGYQIKEIPGGSFATVTMTGPYERIAKEYKSIFAWIGKHNYQIAGPFMEIYLKGGPDVPPQEYLTEVRVMVAPKA
jgi:AraC family transcriptional regulator